MQGSLLLLLFSHVHVGTCAHTWSGNEPDLSVPRDEQTYLKKELKKSGGGHRRSDSYIKEFNHPHTILKNMKAKTFTRSEFPESRNF